MENLEEASFKGELVQREILALKENQVLVGLQGIQEDQAQMVYQAGGGPRVHQEAVADQVSRYG